MAQKTVPENLNLPDQLLVMNLEDWRIALPLPSVGRTFRMVEITALPQAPSVVQGVVNIRGQVVPVFDLRRRFHLAERDPAPSDQLVLARTDRRPVALVTDGVEGVIDLPPESAVTGESILPRLDYIAGVVKLDDGLILIHDLTTFLSLDEERELDRALGGKADSDE